MRAASLFLIFVLVKLAVLSGHSFPLSAWAVAAYFWQDALVALLFAVLEWSLPSRAVWVLYGMIALYTTVNIPVGRALATPLTRPMLRAARGPLSASFLLYITWVNLALMLAALAAAAFLPKLLRRSGGRFWAAAGFLMVATGPAAAARVDTVGWDRNVLLAVLSRTHVESRAGAGDWRQSQFPEPAEEDLSYLRGSARGRNVIMISLESTAAQYLPLYGGAYEVTPNLDAFTQSAVVFDNAYAVYPESIKGLHSVLCSAFPAFGSVAEDYEKVPCRSIAQVLAEAGYRTAMFHSGRFEYLGMESVIRNRGFQTLEDAGDIGGNHNSSFGVDEPSTGARMLAWIDRLPKDQPFFLTYLPIAGHHPYDTPERGPFPDADEIGRYRNALHYGDVSLGTLFDGLRARGLDRNTLWVIYGDHGEAFGQHEGNYAHTFFLYEENVHVPFLIVMPGELRNRSRASKIVSLVDTAPTVLDLLGIGSPGGYQGVSMLDAQSRMALFFTDYSLGILGLRDGPWKFTYETGSGRSRMFNLGSDPQEKVDLAPANENRAQAYRAAVREWIGAQGPR